MSFNAGVLYSAVNSFLFNYQAKYSIWASPLPQSRTTISTRDTQISFYIEYCSIVIEHKTYYKSFSNCAAVFPIGIMTITKLSHKIHRKHKNNIEV